MKFPEDVMQAPRMTEKTWEIEAAVDVEIVIALSGWTSLVPEDIGLVPDRGRVDLSPDHKGTQDIMMTETKEVAPTPGNLADLLHLDTDSGLVDLGPDHKGAQDIMVNVTKEVALTPGAVANLLHPRTVLKAAQDTIQ